MKFFSHRFTIFIRKSLGLFVISALAGSANASMLLNFKLLTSDAAIGVKPSASRPNTGDWLVFTGDDQNPGATYNPNGAVSHNFADIPGLGGPTFDMAPSLTGDMSLELTANDSSWDVTVKNLAYVGQATPVMFMNQFLVTPESAAAMSGSFGVDGVGNSGSWNLSNWELQYDLDFYFATNADGEPASTDVDAAFNNKTQTGYLLPVYMLTATGSVGLSLNDPAGMFAGDFVEYLVTEIVPRLPANATYLLVTQMDKVRPDYSESGLPISTNSYIGNTTIAWTTDVIPLPEPSVTTILAFSGLLFILFQKRQQKLKTSTSH
ncbi:MAG: hypothetical protein ACK5LK_09645 [Chthoniobacterales bacterium]